MARPEAVPGRVSFARELNRPAFAPGDVLAGKDPRTLARALLAMMQPEFSSALVGSPMKRVKMKRAKLRGLERNAAVVLGNVGVAEDADALTRALDDHEPLVREHAAWALARLRARDPATRQRETTALARVSGRKPSVGAPSRR